MASESIPLLELSVWPALGCLAIWSWVASTPLFAAAELPPIPSKGRVQSIDGLRGYLALGVLLHHAAIYPSFLSTGVWSAPRSRLYANLGPVSVAIFFMITGYLFWSQLLATDGRPGWVRLYALRVTRIAPVYLIASSAALVVIFASSGFALRVGSAALCQQVVQWLSLGVVTVPDVVNGMDGAHHVIAGVAWTLRYEWRFYLALWPLAQFARGRAVHLVFTITGFALSLSVVAFRNLHVSSANATMCVALFFTGMLVASLRHAFPDVIARRTLSSGIAVAGVGLALALSNPNSVPCYLLLGVAFFQFASGADVFGLLSWRGSQRLGNISYGIYLIHGLVLWLVFHAPAVATLTMMKSSAPYWFVVVFAGLLTISVSAVLHLLVERPGIQVGRRLTARLQQHVSHKPA